MSRGDRARALLLSSESGGNQAQGSYYTDEFDSFGKFDYVLANPPFNVDA